MDLRHLPQSLYAPLLVCPPDGLLDVSRAPWQPEPHLSGESFHPFKIPRPRQNRRRSYDHVILSPPIEEGVTLTQWETSRPMTPAAIAKFEDPTYFEKIYDVDGVRIYRVKWEAHGDALATGL
jgi:hypothetical protein